MKPAEIIAVANLALSQIRKKLPFDVYAARPGICMGTPQIVDGSPSKVLFRRGESSEIRMEVWLNESMVGRNVPRIRTLVLPQKVQDEAGKVLDQVR